MDDQQIAWEEILANAKRKAGNQEKLTRVEQTVLAEHLISVKKRFQELEKVSPRTTLQQDEHRILRIELDTYEWLI